MNHHQYPNIGRLIPVIIFCLISFQAEASENISDRSGIKVNTIDQNDTIVFDLANGFAGAGYIEFPVYFISDDTINAVDFAFRFNQALYTYDTIYSNIASLSYSEYLNPGDSTLRFTSFSIPVLTDYDPVAWVRFLTSSNIILSGDFNNVEAYLNGDLCSYRFTDGTTLGAMELLPASPVIYPNPSGTIVTIGVATEGNLLITDAMGRQVFYHQVRFTEKTIPVDVSEFSAGWYTVTITDRAGRYSCDKMLVVHRQ